MKKHQKAWKRRLGVLLATIVLTPPTPIQAQPLDTGTPRAPASSLDLRLKPGDLALADSAVRPDFSGRWVLDPKHSDDPKDVIGTAVSDDRGASGGGSDRGGPGGQAGRGVGPAGGGGPGGQTDRQGRPGGGGRGRNGGTRVESVLALLGDRLDILHREPSLEIQTAPHRKRKLYTDRRGPSIAAMGVMGSQVSTAGWQGNQLVIRTSNGAGEQILQRLRILTGPRRLELVTELPPRDAYGNSVMLRQIFVPDDARGGESGPLRRGPGAVPVSQPPGRARGRS